MTKLAGLLAIAALAVTVSAAAMPGVPRWEGSHVTSKTSKTQQRFKRDSCPASSSTAPSPSTSAPPPPPPSTTTAAPPPPPPPPSTTVAPPPPPSTTIAAPPPPPSTTAAAPPPPPTFGCTDANNNAKSVADSLISTYWSAGSGLFNDGETWTDANAYEDLNNYMLFANSDDYADIAPNSVMGALAVGQSNDAWAAFFNGSNDDTLWVVLMLWKVADYLSARGQDNSAWMNSANILYNQIAAYWDDTCGGGIWWSSAKTYKNAITNQLFLITSAEGYIRTGNQQMLTNAENEWAWLYSTGMRNGAGLFNDGLDTSTCQNNGQTTWTYNQAVVASGLAALYKATGSTNTTLLDQAEISLDATIAGLTTNNILRESCDDADGGGSACNHDQQAFKGLWMKHLQYYLDNANDPQRTAKYAPFINSQESAVVHYGTGSGFAVGSVWYAPDNGGSVFQPQTYAAGLAEHNAAAKYGTC